MVKEIIYAISPISNQSVEVLENLLEYKTLDKGELFIQLNKINTKEYFILSGVCRSYLINPDGEEITISFYTSNSILSPHITRTSKGRSILYYQALTTVSLATIDSGEFEKMMIEHEEVRNFGNSVLRNELANKVDKEVGLASLTAKQRLLKFRAQFPLLENLVAHSMIASYLGITNISLSRLRKELV